MREVVLSSPAKINNTLFIGGRSETGLHDIETEMTKVSLCDEVRLFVSDKCLASAMKAELSVQNPHHFSLPKNPEENLVIRAARIFFQGQKKVPRLFRCELIKNIPSQAGLGGGSGNAAAVLNTLSQLFPEKVPKDFLERAHNLGSDIPFFLSSASCAFVTEQGKKVIPLPKKDKGYLLFVKPKEISYSTAWAYEQWDKNSTRLPEGNDFQPLLFSLFPLLQKMADTLCVSGAKNVQLCGSGSTLYAFFASLSQRDAARSLFPSTQYWTGVS